MLASFYNGVEGVKTQNFGMDVTANNISNVNTVGFKASNAEFKDIFYSSVSSQSLNPAQKGSSAMSAASKLVFSQGSPVASEGEFDVALQGKGFFGVSSGNGIYYTRNGSFRRDVNGSLVDAYGNLVLGTMNPAFTNINYSPRVSQLMGEKNGNFVNSGFSVSSKENFNLAASNAQGPISVPTNMYLPPEVTKNVKWSGNLSSDVKTEVLTLDLDPNKFKLEKTTDGKYIVSGSVSLEEIFSAKAGDKIILNFSDANGVKKSFEASLDENLNFTSNALNLAGLDEASLQLSSAAIATEQERANSDFLEAPVYNADGSKSTLRVSLERILPAQGNTISYRAIAQIYDSNNQAVGTPSQGNLLFDQYGALLENTLVSVNNPNGGVINIDLGTPYDATKVGSGFNGIYVKPHTEKNILTQQDGVGEGFFQKYGINEEGNIVAQFSNGKNAVVAKLALYNFINEEGLMAMGDNIYSATVNSGEASFITKNGAFVNTAKFRGGYLEQANVDLGTELSNLMVIQRAFDASSKSITTSDEMIQKAINMKR